MAIFSSSSKNKVYLRRKSLRLADWAMGLAGVAVFALAGYFYTIRNEDPDQQIDQLSTDTLAYHEPIKYMHLQFLSTPDQTPPK
jgi:hypothetical protein